MRLAHDLVYYGKFSYHDVEHMPVVERDAFLGFTKENRDAEIESMKALTGAK